MQPMNDLFDPRRDLQVHAMGLNLPRKTDAHL